MCDRKDVGWVVKLSVIVYVCDRNVHYNTCGHYRYLVVVRVGSEDVKWVLEV